MMGGEGDTLSVWSNEQLNQDLSNSYIFTELPTGPRMDRQHSFTGASDYLHLSAREIKFPPPYHPLIRI